MPSSITRTYSLCLLSVLFAPAQWAQSIYLGKVEVGAFGGLSKGLDRYRGMGGGNIGVNVSSWLVPYGEISYFPGITRERSGTSTVTQVVRYEVPVTDVHGGVQLRLPKRDSSVIPYVSVGAGMIRSNFRGEARLTFEGQTIAIPINDKSTDAAVNFGGGLRWYVRETLGIRVEAKTYRPVSGQYRDTFFKVTAGVFYVFK